MVDDDDDDDDDLSRQPNVLPLSSSMLPPPLIDRRGFFGTTFDDRVPRCRETVRNASRAAALNIVVEGGAFLSFFFAL